MKLKRRAVNLLLVLASLLVTSLAAEVVLRFVLSRSFNPFQPDGELGFRLKPDFDGFYPWVRVRTDDAGHRVPRETRVPPTGKILFVGDSVTFGFGVRSEESFPFRFGEHIGRPQDVANAAVPGYNLEQVLGILREELRRSRPEAVFYGLCLNDIGSATRPIEYEDINPHRKRMREGGFLSSSMLVAFLQRRLQRLGARFDGSQGGPVSRVSFLRDLDGPEMAQSLATFDLQWAELEQIHRQTGIPVTVLILPFREQVEEHPEWRAPQEFLADKCASSPIVCLDPLSMLLEHRQQTLYNGASSLHFNPLGHRLLADWLADLTETHTGEALRPRSAP